MSSLSTAGLDDGVAAQSGAERAPAPLTEKERALVARLLSDPFAFPLEFKAWLGAYLEANPPLNSPSSISGLERYIGSIASHKRVAFAQLGAPAGSVDLSLPAGFTNATIKCLLRGTVSATNVNVQARMNGSSTAGHYYDVMGQDHDTAHISSGDIAGTATSVMVGFCPAATAAAFHYGGLVMEIFGYASGSPTKPFVALSYGLWASGTVGQTVRTVGGEWALGGSPITKVTLFPSSGNWDTGSMFAAYET